MTNQQLWNAVDRLLGPADLDGILANKLGPLAARRLRALGEPVPPALAEEEKFARLATMTAIPLLRRIRDLTDAPLLLAKGPEVAWRYPGRARSFVDIDLLTDASRSVHESLKSAGFVEAPDADLVFNRDHLLPLVAPGLWMHVEIHFQPILTDSAKPPPIEELVEAAVPSVLGIDGLSAPSDVHHALMLAGHAWDHEPLRSLRDLVDVAVVADGAEEDELFRTARAWGVERVWRATHGAAAALFGDGRPTVPIRLFGRHLARVRERTVLDNHLARWLHSFWEVPPHRALLRTGAALRQELLPEPGETWRAKVVRVRSALLHPRRSMSEHTADWQRDLEGGRVRELP